MGDTTISWTEKTWNPTIGCTRISPGCKHCYAFTLHDMRHAAYLKGHQVPRQYAKPFGELQLMEERLEQPLHWTKPSMIFVDSMSDLFHHDVPFEFIDRVFVTMAAAHWHTFQVLTKRSCRLMAYCSNPETPERLARILENEFTRYNGISLAMQLRRDIPLDGECSIKRRWPLPNVWLGVSVENQIATVRLDDLVLTPAAVRFVSAEPLLGPLNLRSWLVSKKGFFKDVDALEAGGKTYPKKAGLDWVISGGESGRFADNIRPSHPSWFQDLQADCAKLGIPYHFKQWGSWAPRGLRAFTGNPEMIWLRESGELGQDRPDDRATQMVWGTKEANGRSLFGATYSEFPAAVGI